MKQVLQLDEVYGVESSNIDRLAYQGEDAYVVFKNGNVYKYPKTPREVFNSLLKASSVGSEFSKTLRKSEEYEQLKDVVVVPKEDNQIDPSETIEIVVKHKGKEVKVKREITQVLVRLSKDLTDVKIREASNGAMKAMRDLLNLKEN